MACKPLDYADHRKTRLKLEAMNEPVTIGGITVRPGDVIIGDDTGIVAVPREEFERVLAEADKMVAIDHAMERAIRAGAPFYEAA